MPHITVRKNNVHFSEYSTSTGIQQCASIDGALVLYEHQIEVPPTETDSGSSATLIFENYLTQNVQIVRNGLANSLENTTIPRAKYRSGNPNISDRSQDHSAARAIENFPLQKVDFTGNIKKGNRVGELG